MGRSLVPLCPPTHTQGRKQPSTPTVGQAKQEVPVSPGCPRSAWVREGAILATHGWQRGNATVRTPPHGNCSRGAEVGGRCERHGDYPPRQHTGRLSSERFPPVNLNRSPTSPRPVSHICVALTVTGCAGHWPPWSTGLTRPCHLRALPSQAPEATSPDPFLHQKRALQEKVNPEGTDAAGSVVTLSTLRKPF